MCISFDPDRALRTEVRDQFDPREFAETVLGGLAEFEVPE
jgi:hypothetical protein